MLIYTLFTQGITHGQYPAGYREGHRESARFAFLLVVPADPGMAVSVACAPAIPTVCAVAERPRKTCLARVCVQ